MTYPSGSDARAVVRPTAGVRVGCGTTANTLDVSREGETSTMLEPVPWWFWALLKLDTSTSPRTSFPVVCGMTATP
ncbi:MAG: hypothetical protein ACLP0J_04445 [Solirubrobacteraceae bacterium]